MKQFKDITTVDDIFDVYDGGGGYDQDELVLYRLSTLFDSDDTNAVLYEMFVTNIKDLYIDYYINRMDKILSPVYEKTYDYYAGLSQYAPTALRMARVIFNQCFFNWNKLAEGFFADYNPINNYDMKENEGVETNVKSNTETKTTQKYAGYNSGTTLPVATETEGEGETSGTDEFNNSARELTRSGNIGVTTTAQMLTQEFELRKKTLLDKIYEDMDKILFLDYYI